MHRDSDSARGASSGGRFPPGLIGSLLLLTIIIVFALAGLASIGNWSKVLRVGAAALTYAIVLLTLSRGTASLRLGAFAAAGAAGGAVSGLVRPETSSALLFASVAASALLLAPLHWGALRSRSRLIQRSPSASFLRTFPGGRSPDRSPS
jgi:hypothetical protein